jgi:transglutaminase-like putative cysteine protease
MAQEEAPQGGEKQEKPYQRILRSKSFIPIVVVAGLVLVILLSSRLAGRPPQIETITPKTGKPGEVMIITGRYFGRERNGEVRISGISPTSGEYIEWTDTAISVVIPDEAASGLVYVVTKNGKSRGLLFTNSDQIPVPASGPARPGEPSIDIVQPMAARIGEIITIKGKNFGLEKGSSEVYFAWAGGSEPDAAGVSEPVNLVAARDYNYDYVSWTDIEIVLRVPDGAASGNVLVSSDKGRSNSLYFEVLDGAGLKSFLDPLEFSIRYGLSVGDVDASGENALYLWMPQIITTPEQRRVELVSRTPEPMVGNPNGAALYAFTDVKKDARYDISLEYSFERFAVGTQLNALKVASAYDTASEMYKHFTSPDIDCPAASTDIQKALSGILKGEKNPYLKAKRIYDYILAQLSYAPLDRGSDPGETLRTRRGDAFSYTALACTLLRAAGIPARMTSGYLIGSAQELTLRHFWNEFYIETVGWIPMDPLLGDVPTLSPLASGADADLKSFYFGNLDNRHITFTKGLETVNRMSPEGSVRRRSDYPFLLTIHEETIGGITDYRAVFEDIREIGDQD